MLVTTGKVMFWACDVCGRRKPGKRLSIVWRRGGKRGPRPCYTVHEACLGELAKTVLLADDDLVALAAGTEVTMKLNRITEWNCSIVVAGTLVVDEVTMRLPRGEGLSSVGAMPVDRRARRAPATVVGASRVISSNKQARTVVDRKKAKRLRRRRS